MNISTARNKRYFAESKQRKSQPINKKGEVQTSNDNKIDQDFPGFPHGQSKENIINPKTGKDKKTADVNNKDGEKRGGKIKEDQSDGSASAFDAAEEVHE